MMMILGQKFAHFYSTILNYKFRTREVKFRLLILPISYYNWEEYVSKAKDLAAFGYSFLTPIMATGIDQTNLADLKELENELLNLDEVLKPLQSAYTQSGKTNAVTAKAAEDANKAKIEETSSTDTKKEDTSTEDSSSNKKDSEEEVNKDNG